MKFEVIYEKTEQGIYCLFDKAYRYDFIEENLYRCYADVFEEFKEDTVWEDLGKVIDTSDDIKDLLDAIKIVDGNKFIVLTKYDYLTTDGKAEERSFKNVDFSKYLINENVEIYGMILKYDNLVTVAKLNEKLTFDLLEE